MLKKLLNVTVLLLLLVSFVLSASAMTYYDEIISYEIPESFSRIETSDGENKEWELFRSTNMVTFIALSHTDNDEQISFSSMTESERKECVQGFEDGFLESVRNLGVEAKLGEAIVEDTKLNGYAGIHFKESFEMYLYSSLNYLCEGYLFSTSKNIIFIEIISPDVEHSELAEIGKANISESVEAARAALNTLKIYDPILTDIDASMISAARTFGVIIGMVSPLLNIVLIIWIIYLKIKTKDKQVELDACKQEMERIRTQYETDLPSVQQPAVSMDSVESVQPTDQIQSEELKGDQINE